MPFLDAGTAALRYELAGEGQPTIVLIHELGGTLDSWDAVTAILTRRARVLRYDLRGAGASEKLRGPVTFAEMADDLSGLLTGLGETGPVILAGAAIGAGVALEFAARHSGLALGVVAFAPAVAVAVERRAAAHALADAITQGSLRDKVEMAVTPAFPPTLVLDPAIYRNYVAQWLGNDAESYAWTYRMLVKSTLAERLGDIACPVLAVAGEHDAMRSPALVAETVAAIPRHELRTIASGHFMPVQAPALVADTILEFADRLAVQG